MNTGTKTMFLNICFHLQAANTDGNSKTNPVNDEERLTRDFQRKMMSDDEDDSSSSLNKAVRRCKSKALI